MAQRVSSVPGTWAKSSFSGETGCVEVRHTPTGVQVRDSKNSTGRFLEFTDLEWTAFLRGVENGEFHVRRGSGPSDQ